LQKLRKQWFIRSIMALRFVPRCGVLATYIFVTLAIAVHSAGKVPKITPAAFSPGSSWSVSLVLDLVMLQHKQSGVLYIHDHEQFLMCSILA
jgi:hypothetical protein